MATAERENEWAALMRAAIAGDAASYRRFFDLLTPVLRASAIYRGAGFGLDPSEAEDVVQETLLALHLKRHTWDADRPIGPWITTIARNKVIDVVRRRRFKTMLPIDDFAETLPSKETVDASERGDLGRLLNRLGPRQQDLVRSLSIEGRTVQETAERLNISETAVRVALHRAIKTLAALYRDGDR